MKNTLKYNKEIMVFIFILFLFISSRLFDIMELPIFTDEAIYVRWSQIARHDAGWRFISLTDGKQPSFVWLTMIFMRFIEDPLLAGRMVSVGAGLGTTVGLFFLGRELFKDRWIGILSSFLYVIFPMALVYDRMALYESLAGMITVWVLYLEILLVKTIRLDVAIILGMVIGAGVLTKSNGFFSLPFLLFSLLLFDFRQKEWKIRLLKWIGLAAVSSVIALLYYSILRLSPFFHIIGEKNNIFVYPFNEWLIHPTEFFVGNLRGLFDWLSTYLTWPFLLLVVFSFIVPSNNRKQLIQGIKTVGPIILAGVFIISILKFTNQPNALAETLPFVFFGCVMSFVLFSLHVGVERWGEKALLFLCFVTPFVYLAFFGRTLYPRFIFFMALFLLPLVAYSFFQLQKLIHSKILFVFCFLFFVFLPIRSDYYILTNFAEASIPDSDLGQYNNDWPAGGGIKEAVIFFEKRAQKEKIFVGTQGTFGLMPFALEIYLWENPNIEIFGLWPIGENPPKKLIEKSRTMPTFAVFYQPCDSCEKAGLAPGSWPLTLVAKYQKPAPARFFSIYQVNSR